MQALQHTPKFSGGMKIHLDYCPKRKRPDLLCGHCELRVNDWPTMVRHLNRKDMEKQLPCDPQYKMDVRVTKLFPTVSRPRLPRADLVW